MIKEITKKLENRTTARTIIRNMHCNWNLKKIDNILCCSFWSVAFERQQEHGIPVKNVNCVFCSSFFWRIYYSYNHTDHLHVNVKETSTFHVKCNKLAMSDCRDRKTGLWFLYIVMAQCRCEIWWQAARVNDDKFTTMFATSAWRQSSVSQSFTLIFFRLVRSFFHDLCCIWEK